MHKNLYRTYRTLVVRGAGLLLAYFMLSQLASAADGMPVKLAWDANPETFVVGYNIYRSTQSGSFTGAPINGSTPVSGTSYSDSNVQSGGTYYYVIKAMSSDGTESAASNQVQAIAAGTAGTPVQELPSPTGLNVACSADMKTFTVRWNAVTGADSYYLRVDYLANNTAADWDMTDGVDYSLNQYAGTSFTGSVIANQSYDWWVHAYNATSGLSSSSSGSFTCSDKVAPTVSMNSPLSGASVTGSVTISATAADNMAVAGVQFKLNGANLGPELTAAPYSMPWDTTKVSAGSYTLTAVARDAAGNQTTAAPVTVNVSNELPAPAGLSATCSADMKTFTVRWNAVAGATSYYLRVDYLANNTAADWDITDGVDYSLNQYTGTSFTGSVIANQSYDWWVHAYNATSGLSSSASGTLKCSDTQAPSVAITSPVSGASVSTSSVTIKATASDNVGVVGVQFRLNGAKLGAEVTTAPFTATWNAQKASGTYTIDAVARDAAGNKTVSAAITAVAKKGSIKVQMDRTGAALDNNTPVVSYSRPDADSDSTGSVAIISFKVGDVVVSEASVPASAPITDGRVYVSANGPVNTGMAIANDNDEPASISFDLTDRDGNDVAHGSFTLDGGDNFAAFINQAPFNLAAPIEGSLTIKSSVPVAVTALRGLTNERGEFLMTTLPIGSLEAGPVAASVVMPHFADGGGYTTQVMLTNPTNQMISGTVQFMGGENGQSGSALAMTVNGVTDSIFSYSIPPRSFARMVTNSANADVQTGYVLVSADSSSVAPQGISIFSYSAGGVTVSEAGFGVAPVGTALRTYVDGSGNALSGVAIANTSNVEATATIELRSADQTQTGLTATITVPAHGHLARFVNELLPNLPEGFTGELRLTSSQAIAALGVRMHNNERGDLLMTAIPVVNESAAQAGSADYVFPLVVTGGGYSTLFVGNDN